MGENEEEAEAGGQGRLFLLNIEGGFVSSEV